MSKSKFADIFKTRGTPNEPPAAESPASARDEPGNAPLSEQPLTKRKAKYANQDYLHTTVYIKRTVMNDLKKALLDEPEDKQEFSELVEVLASKWIEDKKKANAQASKRLNA